MMFDIGRHGAAKLYKSRFGHFMERQNITCAYHSLKISTEYFPSSLMNFIQDCIRSTPIDALERVNTEKRLECLGVLERLCNIGILIPKNDTDNRLVEAVRHRALIRTKYPCNGIASNRLL